MNNMTEDDEIRVKIMYLAFGQRIIFTDHHPRSLFVLTFVKKATLAQKYSNEVITSWALWTDMIKHRLQNHLTIHTLS